MRDTVAGKPPQNFLETTASINLLQKGKTNDVSLEKIPVRCDVTNMRPVLRSLLRRELL